MGKIVCEKLTAVEMLEQGCCISVCMTTLGHLVIHFKPLIVLGLVTAQTRGLTMIARHSAEVRLFSIPIGARFGQC